MSDMILTPTRRLAQSYRDAIDVSVAPTPLVYAWQDYVSAMWHQLSHQQLDVPLCLSAWQSEKIWFDIIQADGLPLLNVTQTAQQAYQAWQLMQEWQLPMDYCATPSIDVAQFLKWAQAYSAKLKTAHWLDMTGRLDYINTHLALLLPHYTPSIHCVGFDDWPPAWASHLKQLSEAGIIITHENTAPAPESKPQGYYFPDVVAEWRAAANWAKEYTVSNPGAQVAVVIPNLSTVRARLEWVFEEQLTPYRYLRIGEKHPKAFNISGGQPLLEVPVIEAAVAYLSGRITSSIFLKTPKALVPKRQGSVAAHVAWVIQCLSDAGWPGERVLDSMAFQAIEMWHGVLQKLQVEGHIYGVVSHQTFLHWLSTQLKATLFQMQSEHDVPAIHVLGILEAAGMSFDGIWVTGLYDGQWPMPASPNPFIDIQAQRELGMPHASQARETDFSKKILQTLLAQSKVAILSTPQVVDDAAVLPSPLLQQCASTLTPGPAVTSSASDARAMLESICDKTLAPLPDTNIAGGAGVLKAQSLCPFRAVAQYRWQAEPTLKTTVGLSALERGQWLHKALELFWQSVKSQAALNALPDLASKIEETVWQAAKVLSLPTARPFFMKTEAERLTTCLLDLMAYEKTRPPFEVVALEQWQPLQVGPLHLKGRIDRVDDVAGQRLLIDYKTGPIRNWQWLGERPVEPQLPLYAINYHGCVGIVALEVNRGMVRWHHIDTDNVEDLSGQSWDAQKATWGVDLARLAQEFADGVCDIAPQDKRLTCQYCHCQSICRRSEWGHVDAG